MADDFRKVNVDLVGDDDEDGQDYEQAAPIQPVNEQQVLASLTQKLSSVRSQISR